MVRLHSWFDTSRPPPGLYWAVHCLPPTAPTCHSRNTLPSCLSRGTAAPALLPYLRAMVPDVRRMVVPRYPAGHLPRHRYAAAVIYHSPGRPAGDGERVPLPATYDGTTRCGITCQFNADLRYQLPRC